MLIRTFECDVCFYQQQEIDVNGGVVGWGALTGIVFNDAENPLLCPTCKTNVANYMDELREENK